MTFSILARDFSTGEMGGAAATGALCVGGWVLRGDSRAGVSASQGASPSTMWGEDVLSAMAGGMTAQQALAHVVTPDTGQDWRQLAVLDRRGGTAVHTGARNGAWRGGTGEAGLVVSGNLLAGPQVLSALRDGFTAAGGPLARRMLAALAAAEAAGGDSRGLQSAALLVVSDAAPPLTLRIDWAAAPVAALHELYDQSRNDDYAAWLATVPTRDDPWRGHD